MTSDRLSAWAQDIIKRAQMGKLRGSVTFSFNDGLIVNAKTEHNDKPVFDNGVKPK